jgi:hypothetical protein
MQTLKLRLMTPVKDYALILQSFLITTIEFGVIETLILSDTSTNHQPIPQRTTDLFTK